MVELDIRIKSLLQGGREAEGITVIIDVFRAGTNIALVLEKGAERIIPARSATLICRFNGPSTPLIYRAPQWVAPDSCAAFKSQTGKANCVIMSL